jgi:hypothetical protein
MNATSKLVKAWESKNAKNAAKAGGISLMALSLAACGGSSTTTTTATDTTTTDTTTTTTTTVDAAQTFTLTQNVIDNVTGGSGDDIIIGDNNTVSAADQIDGGAGNDTLKMYGSLVTGTVTSVENVYFSAIIGDVDLSAASFTNIEFDAATTTAASADVVTVTTGQTVVLDSILDGDAANDANDKGEVEIASAAAVTAVTVNVQGVGAAAAADDVEIDISGTGVATLTIDSSTAANYVGIGNSGSALRTINVTGSTLFDADENALTAVTTIDASATTAGVKFNTTGGTQDLTFTGGSGDDTLNVGAGLDADDVLVFGAGTDTLILTAAALTAATNVQVLEINASTGLERVLSDTAAGDGVAIDFSKLTSVNAAGVVANTPAANAANGAGDVALTVTGMSATDTIVIGGNVVGGTSATAGDAAGGDAVSVATAANGGSDTINLLFTAASNVTGGLGQDDDGADDNNGGDGLAADTIENINISTSAATSDVVFAKGGAADRGIASADSSASVTVGANATITLTGAGDVNLGTVVSAAGVSADDLTIDGSGMTGVLTVLTGVGNDTITGGTKADSISAGRGTDTITTGAGSDTVNFVADGTNSDSDAAAIDVITDFTAGAGGDKIAAFSDSVGGTAVTIAYEAITAANQTAIDADTTLTAAVTQAFTQLGGATEATAFSYDGKTYVAIGATAGTYATGDNLVIELTGVSVDILHADNFV